MNKTEAAQTLAILKVAYPASFTNMGKTDAEAMVNLWERQFQDIPYDIVTKAIDSIISTRTNSFSPTIGEIKTVIVNMQTESEYSEKDAWDIIQAILPRCGYHANEEWEKLPEEIKSAITPRELKRMAQDEKFNCGVESSNFMKTYKEKRKTTKEMKMLPSYVRAALPTNSDMKLLEA